MDDVETLEALLQVVLPNWRFVKDHHLRKFREELSDRGERLASSHELPLWCDRAIVEKAGIFPENVTAGSEERLCLFPSPHTLEPMWQVRQYYWRAAYSARLTEVLNHLETQQLEERWNALDPELQLDAAFILVRDHRVPVEETTDAELFAAFAVFYLTSWRFTPSVLPYLFPTVRDASALAAKLCEGIPEAVCFRGSQPSVVGNPRDLHVSHHPEVIDKVEPPPPERADHLARLADRALRNGNAVRAAIACTQAVAASPTGSTKHRQAAKAAIKEQLVPSLAKVFGWNEEQEIAWDDALLPVLHATVESGWPPAAKFLYDLQRIASDLGQEIYAVDPPAWFLSFGKRPMLRKLTLQRQTILLVHLRKAAKHLDQTALPTHARHHLETLLHKEVAATEERLRESLGPMLHSIFDLVGLVPQSTVEIVAREKVVAELLDRICEHGHIRLGDLRDAFARNAFKFPDLSGPDEFLKGDALLRADKLLARELDGIYHRGEIYLRWFQRGSTAAFGTLPGRILTKFALIPFIAAFMTVAFAQYLEHEGKTIAHAVSKLIKSHDPDVKEEEYVVDYNAQGQLEWVVQEVTHGEKAIQITDNSWIAIGVLAFIYLLLVNAPVIRDAVFHALYLLLKSLSFLLFTLPHIVWHSETVRLLRRNVAVRLLTKWLLVPLAVASLVATFVAVFGGSEKLVTRYFFGVFAGLAIVMLTPFGQLLREGTEEAASDAWRNFRYNLLPGLLSTIAWFFREVLGQFQNLLYTIDEWFRYREGQSKPSLALKMILGIIWFPIAYIFRFAIFLLIEPQINPLKHFPTVTVSHKLLLPMIPSVAGATQINEGLVAAVFTGIPGIFGFLVWELKENWKLYAANRRENLGPVPLGHHGETMRGLLRPGFHSGTVPNDFRKIRTAIRKADKLGGSAYAPKPLDGLHAVEHALHSFAERDLIALLKMAKSWHGLNPTCSGVHLGVQSVRIEIAEPSLSQEPIAIIFWHSDSEIHGRIATEGFVQRLGAEQLVTWTLAVRGFFALAAVEGEHAFVHWQQWRDFWQASSGDSSP